MPLSHLDASRTVWVQELEEQLEKNLLSTMLGQNKGVDILIEKYMSLIRTDCGLAVAHLGPSTINTYQKWRRRSKGDISSYTLPGL